MFGVCCLLFVIVCSCFMYVVCCLLLFAGLLSIVGCVLLSVNYMLCVARWLVLLRVVRYFFLFFGLVLMVGLLVGCLLCAVW